MIKAMYADIIFNKQINKRNHYISPGGYEIKTKSNILVGFDFTDFVGVIDRENPSILHVIANNLDLDSFPSAANLEELIQDIEEFTEFYIYAEEERPSLIELEIEPEKILNVRFENDNGEIYYIDDRQLRSIQP